MYEEEEERGRRRQRKKEREEGEERERRRKREKETEEEGTRLKEGERVYVLDNGRTHMSVCTFVCVCCGCVSI